jgi:hypothetical protein
MELTRLAPPGPEVVVSVPAFPADIDDARALARIGEALFATGATGATEAAGGTGTINP